MDPGQHINELHAVWFEQSLSDPTLAKERFGVWFFQSDEFDDALDVFKGLPDRVRSGDLELALSDPRSLLCSVLIVDQLPRNFFRGTAKAFEYDAHALSLCRAGIKSGVDRQLHPLERMFLYMPFQHVEDRDLQNQSLTVFEELVKESSSEWKPMMEGGLDFARKHQQIVEKFGRFPHRNETLGREASPEEVIWLEEDGESFGQ